jgi:uncharacterized protein YukE
VTNPNRPDLTVAVEALEADAARWSEAAADLRAAAAAAAGQVLEPAAFSFAGGAAADAYEALRSRTARLLTEGADNLDAVACALRAGAAAYAAEEATAVQRLDGPGDGPR